ncbi:MAG: hypothetical protein QW474_01030 [Candidatus Aenigmatarchaeota archaeon]
MNILECDVTCFLYLLLAVFFTISFIVIPLYLFTLLERNTNP